MAMCKHFVKDVLLQLVCGAKKEKSDFTVLLLVESECWIFEMLCLLIKSNIKSMPHRRAAEVHSKW